VSFTTVYIWTNSDQPRLESLLVWDWDCGWFDEKDAVFYEVTYEVLVGVGVCWWNLEG
jgi:hypothetical protein